MANQVPYMPADYNYWLGNQFKMPQLGQYARPSYADALSKPATSDPGLAQALPQAVPPGFEGYMGDNSAGNSRSGPGVGMNATTTSPTQFAGALMAGPIGAGAHVLGSAAYNGIMGRPNAPIGTPQIGGLLGSLLAEAFGGTNPQVDLNTPQSIPGQSDDFNTRDGGIAGGAGGSVSPGDPTLGEGPAFLSKGGPVTSLLGPNPPGPDDGFAGLDKGEFVVNAKDAKKHRGLLDKINEGKVKKGLLG